MNIDKYLLCLKSTKEIEIFLLLKNSVKEDLKVRLNQVEISKKLNCSRTKVAIVFRKLTENGFLIKNEKLYQINPNI